MRLRKKEQQHLSNQNNRGKVSYQICRKFNHNAIDCWYRFDISYQLKDRICALAIFALNNWKDQSLIVGSSATPHMTNDVVNFSYIKPYHGNNVIYVGVGNWTPMTHIDDAYFYDFGKKFKPKRYVSGS